MTLVPGAGDTPEEQAHPVMERLIELMSNGLQGLPATEATESLDHQQHLPPSGLFWVIWRRTLSLEDSWDLTVHRHLEPLAGECPWASRRGTMCLQESCNFMKCLPPQTAHQWCLWISPSIISTPGSFLSGGWQEDRFRDGNIWQVYSLNFLKICGWTFFIKYFSYVPSNPVNKHYIFLDFVWHLLPSMTNWSSCSSGLDPQFTIQDIELRRCEVLSRTLFLQSSFFLGNSFFTSLPQKCLLSHFISHRGPKKQDVTKSMTGKLIILETFSLSYGVL